MVQECEWALQRLQQLLWIFLTLIRSSNVVVLQSEASEGCCVKV